MRCKQGDMALIVKSTCGNEGKVVTCLEFVGEISSYKGDDYWRIDIKLVGRGCISGKMRESSPYARDAWLMPIGNKDPEKTTEKELEAVI